MPLVMSRRADLTIRRNLGLKRRFETRMARPERSALKRLGRIAERTGTSVYLVGGACSLPLVGRMLRECTAGG